MSFMIFLFSLFSVLGLIDKIIGRWRLAEHVDTAVLSMSSTMLPYIGICCGGAVFLNSLTSILSTSPSYLPAAIIGSLLSPDLGGYHLCQALAPEKEWFLFCSLILSGCIGQFISFQLPIFGTAIHDSQDTLIQGFIAGIITAPLGVLTGGMILGISLSNMLFNCLPIWIICALITFGFFKRPNFTQQVLRLFGRFLQNLCILLFAATVILLQINPDVVLSHLADSMITFVKMLTMVIGGTILSTLIQRYLKAEWIANVFHLESVSFCGMLLNSISSIAMSPLWTQMSPRGKRINAAFAVSGAYMFGGQLIFAVKAESSRGLLAYFAAKLIAGISGILLALVQEKLFSKPVRQRKTENE